MKIIMERKLTEINEKRVKIDPVAIENYRRYLEEQEKVKQKERRRRMKQMMMEYYVNFVKQKTRTNQMLNYQKRQIGLLNNNQNQIRPWKNLRLMPNEQQYFGTGIRHSPCVRLPRISLQSNESLSEQSSNLSLVIKEIPDKNSSLSVNERNNS